MRIAITGANGFVGSNLLDALEALGADVVAVARSHLASPNWRPSPTLDRDTDPQEWAGAFKDVDVVVHTAARADAIGNEQDDSLDAFRRINRDGAIAMARGAALAGVGRIVFISTVKVLGETTTGRQPFQNDDVPAPSDPYAISKWEAEDALDAVTRELGIDLVVLRSPLVYGPGVGGNIAALQRMIRRGVWLPLGSADANRRSMISTTNLCTAIYAAAVEPEATGKRLIVSDDEDISTKSLVSLLASQEGRRARLVPMPVGILYILLTVLGRKSLWSRLCGDLQVGIAPTIAVLHWRPQLTVAEGMAGMAGDRRAIEASGSKGFSSRSGVLRGLDILLVIVACPLVLPVCAILLVLIKLDSPGNPLFIQDRVGLNGKLFRLFKLRTMSTDTGDVPSHEVAASKITRIGKILRRTKLDELPQLWNVLKGEMTFVGPRPCLPSQQQLIDERSAKGLFDILPGVTGPAQIAKVNMETPELLAEIEADYFQNSTLYSDLMIIGRTVFGAGRGDVVCP